MPRERALECHTHFASLISALHGPAQSGKDVRSLDPRLHSTVSARTKKVPFNTHVAMLQTSKKRAMIAEEMDYRGGRDVDRGHGGRPRRAGAAGAGTGVRPTAYRPSAGDEADGPPQGRLGDAGSRGSAGHRRLAERGTVGT